MNSLLRRVLPGVFLVLMIVSAYLPALHGGFIWDDDAYVTANPLLTEPDGLWRIWFSAHHQSQYFPLTFTVLRVERALWGLNPMGYHALNVLLHSLNALLVWTLLKRLAVPGAWLSACIFALHPVQVETVAWITEIKNLLSTLFYLLALLAWVRFAEQTAEKVGKSVSGSSPLTHPLTHWQFYALALVLYALALLSKTTACTLPAAIALVVWWKGERLGWRRLLELVPFVALGLAMGLVSVWWERHLGSYQARYGLAFSPIERLLMASRALWFYLSKLVWPVDLTFSYPRWEIRASDPRQYLWALGWLAVAVVLWKQRKALGRGSIVALAFFAATLAPLLGFFTLYTFYYSFVADHYQYLACLGPIALAAAAAVRLWRPKLEIRNSKSQTNPKFKAEMPETNLPPGAVKGVGQTNLENWNLNHLNFFRISDFGFRIYRAPAAALFALLGALTWHQAEVYRTPETLWRDTLKKNPGSWLAHNNLGMLLAAQGDRAQAESHYRAALELNPEDGDIHYNLGNLLVATGRSGEAIAHYEKALSLNPTEADLHNNLGIALYTQHQTPLAIQHFRQALRYRPTAADTHYNLGIALESEHQWEEARREYLEALRLKPDSGPAKVRLKALPAE